MPDLRISKLAKLALSYCIKVEPGDLVGVQTLSVAEPLALALYEEILEAGAHPHLLVNFECQEEIFFAVASDEQLSFVSPIREAEFEGLDRMITIYSSMNLKSLTNIDPAKQAKRRAAYGPLMKRMVKKLIMEGRYLVLPYPTPAMAQEAEMGIREYEDFTYGACHVDEAEPIQFWRGVSRKQAKVVDQLNRLNELRIVGDDTDLTMSVKDRPWSNCDGRMNLPDGEICTSPLESSVQGKIRFTYPGIFQGREVEDISLTFRDGKVVEYSAAKGEDLVGAVLSIDEGASMVGEIGIGTNEGISRFTKNMLFDEKLVNTIHLALGSALPMCGGTNESGIHWDILKDMQEGGRIWGDGQLIYEDGAFRT